MIQTKSEKDKKKIEQDKKLEELKKAKKTSFDAVAATEEGRDVFRYLMDILGFHKNLVVFNPTTGEINKEATTYLEARRSAYLDIRRNISDRHLKKIEFS